MGAAGRYGNGDVQWMTAGKGVQHSEMFPLIHPEKENYLELFQIWLNLPKKNKMVDPHFKMLWKENIPNHIETDVNGKKTTVEVIAGKFNNIEPQSPPPDSWASDPNHEVAVWNFKMEEGAKMQIPKCKNSIHRTLYFYEGESLMINEKKIEKYHSIEVYPEFDLNLIAEIGDCSILLLQGKPISEPVIQYGPFVMNTKQEIQQAFEDYHSTQFGGWPWPKFDQVHSRESGRFAKHSDGRLETKQS
jgi:redox-sensitive bicupin YhaK (pirin superfamily)